MPTTPTATLALQKNDGSGNFNAVTATGIASSGATSSTATYTLAGLPSGNYRAIFTIADAAGNTTQQSSIFYVDNFRVTVSTGSLSIGTMSTGSVVWGSQNVTVTVQTV